MTLRHLPASRGSGQITIRIADGHCTASRTMARYAGQDVCLGLVVAALRLDDDDQRRGFGGLVGERRT
jgi:hypothetical protein